MINREMNVCVTGANGFVGHAICTSLRSRGTPVRPLVRAATGGELDAFSVGDIGPETDWTTALKGVDCLIHCAARVHVTTDTAADPLAEFRRVNVQGSLSLARQAAVIGVRRFIFISSIKVNGEATQLGHPFTVDDAPAPLDAYGVSKMEAEQGLSKLSTETGMAVVIIRPPLVYGPGVKANFATMMRWLQRKVPLPLGAIHNQRSLVALDNLVDLVVTCLTHPAAVNQTFLVSDNQDVSTTELLRRMGQAMGRPACLVPVPVGMIKLAAAMIGRREVAQRLCGSLQVDIEKTKRLLGWSPPLTLDEGLKKVAKRGGCGEAAV